MGGIIDRATVSLRIFGPELDPDEITYLLGCNPSHAHRAGEVVTTPSGRRRIERQGSWHLSTGESTATEIADQVSLLLSHVTVDLRVWHDITSRYQADVFCGLFLDGWNRGFTLPPSLLQQLGARHLAIGFDMYAPVDSWDSFVKQSE